MILYISYFAYYSYELGSKVFFQIENQTIFLFHKIYRILNK